MNNKETEEPILLNEEEMNKIEVLCLELKYQLKILKEMIVSSNEKKKKISLYEPQTSHLTELTSLVYPLIKNEVEIIETLQQIRGNISALKQHFNMFIPIFGSTSIFLNRRKIISNYNQFIDEIAEKTIILINKSLDILINRFSLET